MLLSCTHIWITLLFKNDVVFLLLSLLLCQIPIKNKLLITMLLHFMFSVFYNCAGSISFHNVLDFEWTKIIHYNLFLLFLFLISLIKQLAN